MKLFHWVAAGVVALALCATSFGGEAPVRDFYRMMAGNASGADFSQEALFRDAEPLAKRLGGIEKYRKSTCPVFDFFRDHRALFLPSKEEKSINLSNDVVVFKSMATGKPRGMPCYICTFLASRDQMQEIWFPIDPDSGKIEGGAIKIGGMNGYSVLELIDRMIGVP